MHDIVKKQKEYFNTNITKSVAFRKAMLLRLQSAILSNEDEIYKALKMDLNKSESESYLSEVMIVLKEIEFAIKNLHKWSKPTRVRTPFHCFPARSVINHDPYGSVLILSPWNYPFNLAIVPLVGAIAAGNCAVLKVSKRSVNVSSVLVKIISLAFPSEYIFCTGLNVGYNYDEIVNQHYDFIFFTGSQKVGRIIMQAAAKNLTPLALELGGKSPCIVDRSADLEIAAKRIVWGKFLNAGQTCVAPDYVLVPNSLKDELVKLMKKQIHTMFGAALENDNYPQIINKYHFNRLTTLIDNEPNKFGGIGDEKSLKIEPTIFTDASFESEIMQDEIFGPILPIITYKSIDSVIQTLQAQPKPLALYLFARDKQVIKKVVQSVQYGGGCINDVVMQLINHNLPFGGIGVSGMGNYHGKHSFDTFTHSKGIIVNTSHLDVPLRYAPYTKKKLKITRFATFTNSTYDAD